MGMWKDFKKYITLKNKEMQVRNLAIGVNSTVDLKQDLHIVMLDYDIKDLNKVIESIWEVQEFWNLSDAYIFSTKHGYHVFFWYDQVPYGRLKQIIEFARYVDPMYKAISYFYDHKTIRVAGKYREKDIKFVKKIEGVRSPNDEEYQLGIMKQQEHASWVT